MAVLSANNLTMSFGERTVFSDVSFEIAPRDKVGLIGINGAGKTTLFKLITREYEPAEGGIHVSKDCAVGYMSQHACRDESKTMYDEMLSAYSDVMDMERELESIAARIDGGDPDTDALIERQQYLHTEFDRRDGLSYKSRTRSAILGLGFTENDMTLPCSALSGGQLSKLALGKLLLSGARLLLLDEPTNHLDISSVEWLERWLCEYTGTAVIISHDRYFLDRVTNKTMELERGRLVITPGNYTRFMQLKAQRLENLRRHYDNTMREVHRIEGIIEQQRTFSQERNYITIAHKQKSIDRLLSGLERPERELESIRLSFKSANESGNEVLTVRELAKAYDKKPLFSGVNFLIGKGERVFLLGDNGCGKSTLFSILMRQCRPDNGAFFYGSNVRVGYFDQALSGLDNSKTALDEVWDRYRSKPELEIRKALALFLFKGDDIYKKVELLSGGEKARLALVKLMLSGANLLLLDEPTNHLDIGSREALEGALEDYDGTMLIISHDRYFINKLATRVLWLHEGGVSDYPGNYDSFSERFVRPAVVQSAPKKESAPNDYKRKKEREGELRRARGKLSRCEKEIEELDERLGAAQQLLSEPETAADYSRVLELTESIDLINKRQEELMSLWEQLSGELEELENQQY